jgi:hypothetical protein
LLAINAVLLVGVLLSRNLRAQRPPQANADGVPFLAVNMNPTDVPPMVNINPNGAIPGVEVTRMPPMTIAPSGCSQQQNFLTEVGRSIAGPLVVTYLNAPSQTQVTVTNTQTGNHRIVLANTTQLATAVYLRAGQQLNFDNDVIYSGCRP